MLIVILSGAQLVLSHCQIPCGINDDPMRFDMMAEDIRTIEKSIRQIDELSAGKDKNYNQLVRWIDNKDYHADKLREHLAEFEKIYMATKK